MQGNYSSNNMPAPGYNAMPPMQGIQSQGYNPQQYPYNAAASAYNYYNNSDYMCNQYTAPSAFGQQQGWGFKDKIKNFFRFGRPQPQVMLGPDGHPLPSSYIPKNEAGARRQRYVQDRAGIDDFLGQVDYQRSKLVHHKNLHGAQFEATEGPARGNVAPGPFPQQVGLGPNPLAVPGPYPQNARGQFNPGYLPNQQLPPGQAFMGQPGYPQGSPAMYQQQPGSPMRADFAPAPAGFSQRLAGDGVERTTKTEVKNLPNGGFEEKKESFRREEHVTKASKPSEDKTMGEKLQDKVADAKEWVSDKLSGDGIKETKESKQADGMAKPENVGKDLVEHEDKKTQDIIQGGERSQH